MKAFAMAVVALIVVGGVAYVGLGAATEPSSERYVVDGVRLDADMESNRRFPE